MTSRRSIFNPVKTKTGFTPIRYAVYDDCFRATEYRQMCESFDSILARGLSENATDGKQKFTQRTKPGQRRFYDAYVYSNPRALKYPFSFFSSWSLLDFFSQEFGIPFTSDLMFALHHHQVGGVSGYVHSDYNLTNFMHDPLLNGLNLWNGETPYQGKLDSRPDVKQVCRSLALLYYFNNPEWHEGEGGETAFFASEEPNAPPFEKIAPLNNRLLAFEISPVSLHAYQARAGSIRNCLAFWYHSNSDYMLARFGREPQQP